MNYYEIPDCSLLIPCLGLGCMRMAAKTVDEVERLLHGAVELGINFFDHADIYGDGEAERIFGKALKQSGIMRKDIIIQSKCGIRSGCGYDLSKKYILSSVDGILRRLQVERLDFLLLHRPDALWEPEEIAEAFEQLHNSGKVRYFGVSNQSAFQMDVLQRVMEQRLIVSQMQFSIAHSQMIDSGLNVNLSREEAPDRDGGLMDYCRKNSVLMQAWSPLQYGFFEGSFINSPLYPRLNQVLEHLAQEKDVTPVAVALAWLLRNTIPVQPIIGTMNMDHLKEAAKAAEVELSRKEWYDIYCAGGKQLP